MTRLKRSRSSPLFFECSGAKICDSKRHLKQVMKELTFMKRIKDGRLDYGGVHGRKNLRALH